MKSIGELSKRIHIKIPTVRYSKDMGFSQRPGRTERNQRRHGRGQFDRSVFIADSSA